ncbi:MAG: DUF4476 domain-containing protein [Sphingobacteriales bacterium]|nr:MAG: DUF4476 domain-containing protein [Sphingobacteriales bacterium]
MHHFMITRFFSIILILLIPFIAIAQRGRDNGRTNYNNNTRNTNGAITVFSPDRNPFYLVLNGERMNDQPQTYVTVQGLPSDVYKLEIEFQDAFIPLVREEIEVSGRAVSNMYQIGWKRNRKPILLPASYAPMTGNRYVMEYSTYDSRNQRSRRPYKTAMGPRDFDAARATIRNISFDETKLKTAKGIASTNFLTSDQVLAVCQLFSFEQTRLEFAKFAFARTVDPGNYFKVNSAFSFSSTTDDLNKFLYGM